MTEWTSLLSIPRTNVSRYRPMSHTHQRPGNVSPQPHDARDSALAATQSAAAPPQAPPAPVVSTCCADLSLSLCSAKGTDPPTVAPGHMEAKADATQLTYRRELTTI
jgi:hypothetical protein